MHINIADCWNYKFTVFAKKCRIYLVIMTANLCQIGHCQLIICTNYRCNFCWKYTNIKTVVWDNNDMVYKLEWLITKVRKVMMRSLTVLCTKWREIKQTCCMTLIISSMLWESALWFCLLVLCIGKLCLQNEHLAKQCVPALARELEVSSNTSVKGNVVVVMCDLCVRLVCTL